MLMWDTAVVEHSHEPGIARFQSAGSCASPRWVREGSPGRAGAARGCALERAASEGEAEMDAGEGEAGAETPAGAEARARGGSCDSPSLRGSEPIGVRTVPRASAARFTHTPASSVLTAVIDGPMVTLSALLYAVSHPMWNLTDGDQLRSGAEALSRWLGRLFGDGERSAPAPGGPSAAYASFVRMYALSLFLALLSVVLFVSRLHERCVYGLRSVRCEFITDFLGSGGLGATHVVYASWRGRCLYFLERFLVYFVIVLGGAGFFVISRYLLMVLECADGAWRVEPSIRCLSPQHASFLACSAAVFPAYIVVACRMSASYNDVTYLSEAEDDFPSSRAKLRELLRFWGSTVVKRAGLWTRHPVHGWKFGLSGRLGMLLNWIADLVIGGWDAHPPNQLRWLSVCLWLLTAYALVDLPLRYQPMAEPLSCVALLLFRALLSATYASLALACALALLTGADTHAVGWRTSAPHAWSLVAWAAVVLVALPAAWAVGSRWDWQTGDEQLAQRQALTSGSAERAADVFDEARAQRLGGQSLWLHVSASQRQAGAPLEGPCLASCASA